MYDFKSIPEDFLVKELLDQSFKEESTKWAYKIIKIKKRLKTTHDILDALLWIWIRQRDLWYWWLKDKVAVATQHISIQDQIFTKFQNKIFDVLDQHTEEFSTFNSYKPLYTWWILGNKFNIKLRKKSKLNLDNIEDIKDKIDWILEYWFNNYYWNQRFWRKKDRVSSMIKDINFWKREKDKVVLIEKLARTQSVIFNKMIDVYDQLDYIPQWSIFQDEEKNHYVLYNEKYFRINRQLVVRERKNKKYLHLNEDHFLWEINPDNISNLIPTWVAPWYKMILPPKNTEAWEIELEILRRFEVTTQEMEIFYSKNTINWFRRRLYVYPDINWKHEFNYEFNKNDDLLITLSLPSWAYATSYLTNLFWSISPETCKANGRIVNKRCV